MEHRCTLRIPHQRTVLLTSPPYGSSAAATRDIGLGGAFIETKGPVPPVNTPVSVEFSFGNKPSQRTRLQGMVVRQTADGMGIMFLEPASAVIARLHKAPRDSLSERMQTTATATQPADTQRRVANG